MAFAFRLKYHFIKMASNRRKAVAGLNLLANTVQEIDPKII